MALYCIFSVCPYLGNQKLGEAWLSNLEAKLVVLLKVIKEAMFIVKLLFLVMVSVDIVGVIFMVGNVTATKCTKHVDEVQWCE